MPWMHLVGRILFAMVFIGSGMNHLMKLNDMAGYAEAKGVPAAKAATALTGLMILAGGLMVATGWHRFIGAGLLVIFLVPTSFMMHAFWKESDPQAQMNEMTHFMKNMAMAGAALLIAYYAGTEWPMSL
ncbi:MAG: DoxX family protein [Gemmatimonadetes bacterium]|nr:MAG: DoxX family protein [Gemmatimonadota bacterium]